jgi:hypothetical protein
MFADLTFAFFHEPGLSFTRSEGFGNADCNSRYWLQTNLGVFVFMWARTMPPLLLRGIQRTRERL